MRRLSAARDRELRHAAVGQIAWRTNWFTKHEIRYAWCRICRRDATRQIDWLMGAGFLAPVGSVYPVSVLIDESAVSEYVRKYPS